MGKSVGNFVYNSRYVYNSNFHQSKLLETQYVRRLMSLYKFTNPQTLFSDVVKRGTVSNDKVYKNKSVIRSTTKKSDSKSSHGYGTPKSVQKCAKCVDPHNSIKSNGHGFNIGVKHRAIRSKQCQGVHSVFHENRFAVLTDENIHSDVDSDCNKSIFVELNDGNACSTSKGVSVNTVSHNAHEGKSDSYLPNKTVLLRNSCSPISKQTNKNHEYGQTSGTARVGSINITKGDKRSKRDTIGDTINPVLCDVDKYSLEMNSTAKSYRIREARGATENKKLLAQNKPLFGFIPTYGLQSRVHDANSNEICTDVLQLHTKLREDTRYNYRGLQVPIPSKLNFERWKGYLKNYWD